MPPIRSAGSILLTLTPLAVALFVAAPAAQAQDASAAPAAAPATPKAKLVVATKPTPPFAMKTEDGLWTGMSIELWRRVAEELNVDYEFRELGLDEMLDAVAAGEADVAIAAISVTPDREKRLDFTHSYFTTGLGVAVPRTGEQGFWRTLSRVFSPRFFAIVGILLGITLVGGVMFWLLERRAKTGPFADRKKGIRDGIWWSLVILLGHKGVTPTTSAARIVAGMGMLASLLALSTLTGAIASVLTVGQLDTSIQHPDDLRRANVATIADSTSAQYLRSKRIPHRVVEDIDTALSMVADGRIEAVVYDAPMLKFVVNNEHRDRLMVLPWTFQQQEYAVALADDSDWREPMNRVLLELRNDPQWLDVRFRYLGE